MNLSLKNDNTYFFISKNVVKTLLHQPGRQLKLPSWRSKSIYAISV